MQRGGDERFARSGGGVEDDVPLLEQFEKGGLLRRVKLEATAFEVFQKAAQQRLITGRAVAGEQIVKRLQDEGKNRWCAREDLNRADGFRRDVLKCSQARKHWAKCVSALPVVRTQIPLNENSLSGIVRKNLCLKKAARPRFATGLLRFPTTQPSSTSVPAPSGCAPGFPVRSTGRPGCRCVDRRAVRRP
jgi:hypothetical protein